MKHKTVFILGVEVMVLGIETIAVEFLQWGTDTVFDFNCSMEFIAEENGWASQRKLLKGITKGKGRFWVDQTNPHFHFHVPGSLLLTSLFHNGLFPVECSQCLLAVSVISYLIIPQFVCFLPCDIILVLVSILTLFV